MAAQHSDVVVVFDGPPSHESGRFVEVENGQGTSVKTHHGWKQREDGLWEIGPFLDLGERERIALHMVADSISKGHEILLSICTKDEWEVLAEKLAPGKAGGSNGS